MDFSGYPVPEDFPRNSTMIPRWFTLTIPGTMFKAWTSDDDFYYGRFKENLEKRKNPFRLLGIKSPTDDIISGNLCKQFIMGEYTENYLEDCNQGSV